MSIIVFLVIGYFVIIYTQSKEEYYINCNIILVFCIIFKCQYDIIILTILISGIVTLYCIIPSIGNNNDDDILD
jgi:predicted membrane protein